MPVPASDPATAAAQGAGLEGLAAEPSAPGGAQPGALPRPDFDWNLRPLMATRHLWKATQLAPMLRQRGVSLSHSQIRRLVNGKPRRVSMIVLAALCDIIGCTPSDLITPHRPHDAPAETQ